MVQRFEHQPQLALAHGLDYGGVPRDQSQSAAQVRRATCQRRLASGHQHVDAVLARQLQQAVLVRSIGRPLRHVSPHDPGKHVKQTCLAIGGVCGRLMVVWPAESHGAVISW